MIQKQIIISEKTIQHEIMIKKINEKNLIQNQMINHEKNQRIQIEVSLIIVNQVLTLVQKVRIQANRVQTQILNQVVQIHNQVIQNQIQVILILNQIVNLTVIQIKKVIRRKTEMRKKVIQMLVVNEN
jgi:hypothetical protein